MANLSANLHALDPVTAQAVIRGLQHADRARYAVGVLDQLRLKRMMDLAAVPGFNREAGRCQSVMSEGQRVQAMRTYGQLCFADPDFMPWLLRQPENADMRVKDVGTRVQSGYTGESRSMSKTPTPTLTPTLTLTPP